VALAASGEELRSCKALREVSRICCEKVHAYRHVVSTQLAQDDWETVWKQCCRRFCPSWTQPSDALALVASTIEGACAEVVREHVGELRLDLAVVTDGEAAEGGGLEGTAPGDPGASKASVVTLSAEDHELRYGEELAELRRESRLRVQRFDEQLGEVVADAEVPTSSSTGPSGGMGGGSSSAITAALLEAVGRLLSGSCDRVQLPDITPAWPLQGGGAAKLPSGAALWSLRRRAARGALALESLLSATEAPRDGPSTNLQRLLQAALTSGDPALAAEARNIVEGIRQRSGAAFRVWARCAVACSSEESAAAGAAGSLAGFWSLADDEVAAVCAWGSASFSGKGGAGSSEERSVPVPVQASPFVFERLVLGARRALEVCGGPTCGGAAAAAVVGGATAAAVGSAGAAGWTSPPSGLVAALKVALSESFIAAYTAEPLDLEKRKRTGMNHLLQWLFDLHFIRMALSSAQASGAWSAAAAADADAGPGAYEALRGLLDRSEAVILSDPVDRLLYQPALKSSAKSHVQGVKILLAPLFVDNPLYGFRFKGQAESGSSGLLAEAPPGTPTGVLGRAYSSEAVGSEGFELQASRHQPFRQVLPRFPLLPVAMGSSGLPPGASLSDPDGRFGVGIGPGASGAFGTSGPGGAGTAAAAAGADRAVAAAAAAASSLAQQVGSGFGSLGLGKAFNPMAGSWASGWSGASGSKPPEAV